MYLLNLITWGNEVRFKPYKVDKAYYTFASMRMVGGSGTLCIF